MCVCGCVLVAQSCLIVCNLGDYSPPGSSVHGILQARMENGVGSDSLLQGFFLTQGSNTGRLRCRQILYCLSHQGSPFSTINVLFFLSIVYSFGKSLPRAHTHWRVMLYLLKGWVCKYLEFFSWEICVFFHIYWLIQSCISVWLKGIYFIVWVIIQYYFIQLFMLLQLWPSGALSFSFCVPLTCPSKCVLFCFWAFLYFLAL